ncbi:hypothetical protein CAEBREN_12767 [Caenorhabditis brenneri]|uniref:Uncharacterized protein n=1 Tax=Caenorhabditis brenneri TaxID=135651 RepID=G0MW20_CAEBE|nr:hypothetical protein CAEBREN_12767 [Caenorhabditis brenneri]
MSHHVLRTERSTKNSSCPKSFQKKSRKRSSWSYGKKLKTTMDFVFGFVNTIKYGRYKNEDAEQLDREIATK